MIRKQFISILVLCSLCLPLYSIQIPPFNPDPNITDIDGGEGPALSAAERQRTIDHFLFEMFPDDSELFAAYPAAEGDNNNNVSSMPPLAVPTVHMSVSGGKKAEVERDAGGNPCTTPATTSYAFPTDVFEWNKQQQAPVVAPSPVEKKEIPPITRVKDPQKPTAEASVQTDEGRFNGETASSTPATSASSTPLESSSTSYGWTRAYGACLSAKVATLAVCAGVTVYLAYDYWQQYCIDKILGRYGKSLAIVPPVQAELMRAAFNKDIARMRTYIDTALLQGNDSEWVLQAITHLYFRAVPTTDRMKKMEKLLIPSWLNLSVA